VSVTVLGPHRIGVGDLLDADFQRELWSGASAQAGTPIADWPYNAAIDKDARRRSAAAGMRNGKNTCITAAWDQYNDGGGGWPAYVRDLDLWLDMLTRRRAKHHALIGWGWAHSLPYLLAAGERHGLRLVTIFTWAKPTASPRFVRGCAITKSTEVAVIWRGRERLDVFGPLIRDHVVCTQNRTPVATRGTQHESPKPLAVWMPLVERFTPPGGLLFDPFLGSGVSLVACQSTGRVLVGCDREAWCVEETAKRLNSGFDGLLAGRQGTLGMEEAA